ncbi:hypothetical protein WA1_29745 [Scytonema hofmannii PCC 7110]|uniref:Methyltransferase FkbM domain-containing protein n=1 Tax=Scytonema hofmannii PCC 7110 TaxID=128403 RepID=A0A139X603_9CYAN|nr:FkbM family methyltransferase [Scytonema hofmannii]KYC40128.1 hypothetical protein WA1_29745 [Scytonema hofmannii PCC 7110]
MNQLKFFCRSILDVLNQNVLTNKVLLKLARAGWLPKFIWKRLPVEKTFIISLPAQKSFQYSSTSDDYVGNALFWRGLSSWEPETIEVFYKLAQKSNLVLDIGANTGLFTMLALSANPNSQVLSFEPVPNTYKQLVSHVKRNGWEERCQIYNKAVSNIVGETKFHVPFNDVPLSASLNLQGFRGQEGVIIDIPVTTIDDVCSKSGKIDLIKLDVEGFEDKVLEGMEQVLSNSSPTIIVECNPDGPVLAVENILSKFGYHFFHLRTEGPVAMDKIVPDQKQLYRNFLCTPHKDWEKIG